jgi:predicted ribosome quality control (RQC) complex YloA/Tae2 family protein
MLLRRRLTGGRIFSINAGRHGPRLRNRIQARNELFDEVSLKLVIELTGKHGNLMLLEQNGCIVDCVRQGSAGNTTSRILLPGFPYEPIPQQEKLDRLRRSRSSSSRYLLPATPSVR